MEIQSLEYRFRAESAAVSDWEDGQQQSATAATDHTDGKRLSTACLVLDGKNQRLYSSGKKKKSNPGHLAYKHIHQPTIPITKHSNFMPFL